LCVDDEPNALLLRKLVLEQAGFQVMTASSARDALQLLASTQVDLVLSDQLMPEMTGTQLTKQLKSKFPSLPVVLISGVNELPPDADVADLFMSKSEGPVVMCEKIAQVLNSGKPSD
jgi:CheY-like chemotaxis protein